MFDRPLFRENIIYNLENFFKFYLTTRYWWIWLGIVFFIITLFLFFLRKQLRNNKTYAKAYDEDVFCFCRKKTEDILSFLFLIGSFIITAVYMFSLENSFFENYDTMSMNTTMILKKGVKAMFDYSRIAPLSFWYMNILYAVTHNIFMIKGFVLLHLALAIYILYKVFEFIPVPKRLMMLGVFLFTPTMFQTSNIIYVERSLFLWVGLSLIAARNYGKSGKLLWAATFLFCMNFAIYVKETAILFYFGLLISSFIYNIWKENFTLSSFIHPVKTIKNMPIEFLMGLSLLLYAAIYFLMLSLRTNYGKNNTFSLWYLLDYYKEEIFLMLSTLGVLVTQTIKNKKLEYNPLFRRGGFLLGALSVMLCIIFALKLAPISPHLNEKTYYMAIPVLFCLAYLFSVLNGKRILGALVLVILTYSFVQNYKIYKKEPGHYYREIAEFFAKNLSKNEANSIYLVEKPFCDDFWRNTWMIEVWSSTYLYYFNEYNIGFKYLNKEFYKRTFMPVRPDLDYYFFRMYPWGMPDSGDWLVLHKQADTEDLEKFRAFVKDTPLFENKLFEVYKIQ